MKPNRRLLISVFTAAEVREALIGGARIIDCEDPRTSLGNISPHAIMRLSEAVLAYKRDYSVQTSTNIGEEQLLFDRGANGVAIQKFEHEIAGKAAQAALGVATAMGTRIHPVNIIKIGIDAMDASLIEDVLREIVKTVRRSDWTNHSQIVPVFFIRDVDLWQARKSHPGVMRELLDLREYYPDADGAIDLREHYSFSGVARRVAVEEGYTRVSLNDVHPYSTLGFAATGQPVLVDLVDLCARVGVDGQMLDTPIQLKVAKIGLLKHSSNAEEKLSVGRPLRREGIMTVEDCRWFCDYCHWRGIEAYLAGSIQPDHAAALWQIESLDSIAVRGGASELVPRPGVSQTPSTEARHEKRITRRRVALFVPPEQQ